MTKQEAIQKMREGVKITHEYFSSNEWMTMEDGKIVLEDGVRCRPYEFWNYRKVETWNEGYSIYTP